jgi:hypothetical protein
VIGDPAEEGVSGKHSEQIQRNEQSGGPHPAEATSALADGKGQVGREPGEQSPPREHSEEIGEQQREGVTRVRRLEETREAGVIVGGLGFGDAFGVLGEAVMFPPHFGFGDAALDPEGQQSGQDSDEEDHAPVGIVQDDACDQCGERVADGP